MPKLTGAPRDRRFGLVMRQSEYDRAVDLAAAAGLTLSELMRELLAAEWRRRRGETTDAPPGAEGE